MCVRVRVEEEMDVWGGEMVVEGDKMGVVGGKLEGMVVWMEEEKMEMEKCLLVKERRNRRGRGMERMK